MVRRVRKRDAHRAATSSFLNVIHAAGTLSQAAKMGSSAPVGLGTTDAPSSAVNLSSRVVGSMQLASKTAARIRHIVNAQDIVTCVKSIAKSDGVIKALSNLGEH